MQDLIQVELPDGELMWALVEKTGPRDVSNGKRIFALKGVVEAIRGIGTSVRQGLAEAAPQEMTVEFGLEFSVAEGGLVAALAGVGGNTSLKVTMGWKAGSSGPEI